MENHNESSEFGRPTLLRGEAACRFFRKRNKEREREKKGGPGEDM